MVWDLTVYCLWFRWTSVFRALIIRGVCRFPLYSKTNNIFEAKLNKPSTRKSNEFTWKKNGLNILWPSSIRFVRKPQFILCLNFCEAAGCITKGNSRFHNHYETLLFNPLNHELNPICYLLALLAHHFLHVSRIRVKSLTIRLLMSYIYIYICIYIYIWSTYYWCF